MIRRITETHTKAEVLELLEPLVRTWFDRKFPGLTEPQAYAVPLIHRGENVLISSPTGSGKTLTAFLTIINELYALQKRGELEDQIYAVYVSPLKALANDINRNLTEPLREMTALAGSLGEPEPAIRVAVRSGDTTSQERQRQVRTPPHIFITTPESLALVLSAPKFRQRFADVRWLIIDEIHEVCSSKRGGLLSVTLERLQAHVGRPLTRIGLSATIAPMDEVARFLAGFERGKMRPMNVVEVESRKSLDLSVLCPVRDLTQSSYEESNARMYDVLSGLIDAHRTTLIFTNTRSGTENVSFKLRERGVEDLEAHHGSLSKETRLDVEEKLKNGELRAVVSSTSLELGIDIGYIDLVVQIGSPKSIAKGLQRIGRAGHAYGETARGRLVVFDTDDLVECATLARNAYDNRIDRVDIPRNSLDVLAQAVVGMSLEQRWDIDEAFDLVRRSYTFHDLPRKDFLNVLDYLSSRNPDIKVYAKIWYDDAEKRLGKKKGTRYIYYTNVGTIPEEGSYRVVSERGSPLGDLSEKFVEFLNPADVFVLGGRTYQFLRVRGMTVYVKDASGRRPTVPSWTGEMLPRSFDLSVAVGRFRAEVAARIDREGEDAAEVWLRDAYRLDAGSAKSVVSYIQEQRALIPDLPTDETLLIEGYVDPKGNRNLIFHFPFGRRTNDALSRAFAFALGERLKTNVRVSVTDDNFLLTVPRRFEVRDVLGLVTSEHLETLLRRAVRNTELFKQRFRHCATRAFMVLRSYKGRDVSIGRQQLRSQRVLDWFHELEDFPVVKEAYNEVMNEVMDLRHAREVLRDIESGKLAVKTTDFSTAPSPFAFNVVAQGMSDLVLMEDRSALLRELHREVLRKILPESEIAAAQLSEDVVREHFRKKLPRIARREDLLSLVKRAGAMNLLREKGRNPYARSDVSHDKVRAWARQLIDEGCVQSVWTNQGVVYAPTEDVPVYAAVYAQSSRRRPDEDAVLDRLAEGPATFRQLLRTTKIRREKLTEVLRKLERSYEVHRTGIPEATYHRRAVEKAGFETALDTLLTRLLDVDGPRTVHDLAFALGLEDDLVGEALRDLEAEGVVGSGHFLAGGDYQYMLVRDLNRLRAIDDVRPRVEESQVKAFLLGKQFGLEDIDAYFDRFHEAGMPFDVFNHVKTFDWDDWIRRRSSGEILEGRFLNGRVRYIRKEDAPLFLSAFPREPLSTFEAKVLDVVRRLDGIDLPTLVSELGEDHDRVKEALDNLDWNCYVIRRYQDESWTSRNVYVAFDVRDDLVDGAEDQVILLFLRHSGPAPLSAIREYGRFRWDDLERTMERLEEEGTVVRVLVQGKGEGEMFVLADELDALGAAKPEDGQDRTRVLSLLDPWVQPLWAQVAARWGQGWLFPIVRDGGPVGVVEKWEMSGCLEVRSIDLVSPEVLPEALRALDAMMPFYRHRGFEVIRLVGALGKGVAEIEDLSPFLEAGFAAFDGFLAKGEIVPTSFDRDRVLAYVLWRQGVHPDRAFQTPAEAAEGLLGIRSDFAARLRVREFVPLERLHRRGDLVKGQGVPGFWTYCTEDDLRLFRRAKDVPLSRDMRKVLEVVREEEPVSRSQVLTRSPLGRSATDAALKRLYRGSLVTRDAGNAYRTVRDVRTPTETARREVLWRILESFGIFSAENLAAFTRFEYNMAETRRLLREFEREGRLVKGFFVRGDRTLYWMLASDVDRVQSVSLDRSFVLTPLDNLAFYLRSDIQSAFDMGSCWVVFSGPRMVGAFKARRRKREILVTDFRGDAKARRIVKAFEDENGLVVGEESDRISDHEIMEWYAKMYGRSASK